MDQSTVDLIDSRLFSALQEGLPLVEDPYAELARRLGTDEEDILSRTGKLLTGGQIRLVGGSFHPRQLGYLERLVIFHVLADHVDAAASALEDHPGIVECHECKHDYNLWFTLVVPPGSDPEQHIEKLTSLAKATAVRSFPDLKVFKHSGRIPLHHLGVPPQAETPGAPFDEEPVYEPLSPTAIRIVQMLQRGFPLNPRPFDAIASELSIAPDALIERVRDMVKTGRMVGITADVNPARLGLPIAAWVLWQVPEARVDEVGQALRGDPRVLRCSRRKVFPAWGYNLYAWLRVASTTDLEDTVRRLSSSLGIENVVAVPGLREFTSRRKIYYTPEDWQWDKAHLGPRSIGKSNL